MSVDHRRLFERVARELPSSLKEHLFVAGSLAAACHFAPRLQGQVVNTKDADLVIHPARDLQSAADIARQLLTNGWRRRDDCTPAKSAEPAEALRAIRLYPPEHDDYFVELLTVPEAGSSGKAWVALELDDGWYGLPSFEFLALTSFGRERSEAGLEYAAPSMMALANLLSHPTLGHARMSTLMGGRALLRAAKDLGRVLALARLSDIEEVEAWPERWHAALEHCFPERWRELARRSGDGLRELQADAGAFEEAWFACDVGLLNGLGVTIAELQAMARRVLQDCIEPLAELAAQRS